MREIAQQVSTVDTGKIAILAALNLTDELFQCRKNQDGDRVGPVRLVENGRRQMGIDGQDRRTERRGDHRDQDEDRHDE